MGSSSPDRTFFGMIADEPSSAIERYSWAFVISRIFYASTMGDWKQLRSWAWEFDLIVSFTDKVNDELLAVTDFYGHRFRTLGIGYGMNPYVYDKVIWPDDIGWGVDKNRYATIARNRRPKSGKPAVCFLSQSSLMASIESLGYVVRVGLDALPVSDIAIEPNPVFVPEDMFLAASSGVPVVSTSGNAVWTKQLGVYEGVYLDNLSPSTLMGTVCDSDYVYAGMIARDLVPNLSTFRRNARGLLRNFVSGVLTN